MEDTLKAVSSMLNNAKDLPGALGRLFEEHAEMKKQIESFQAQAVESLKSKLMSEAQDQNGIKVIKAQMNLSAESAKNLAFKLKEAYGDQFIAVLGTLDKGKPMISVMMGESLVKEKGLNAGQMVREAGKLIQGGGGGQAHFATAGGKNAEGMPAAIDKVIELAEL